MSNTALAQATLTAIFEKGVREICVCPGSRNAPWIQLLTGEQASRFRCYYFFEERSAAFFALGRIRATTRPVAVMTTSGTAAAELLPATMEAHYSALPLVLMTADRPRRFRGTGAPQTAEQVGLYGQYCSEARDLEAGEAVVLPVEILTPLHLNVCFEEPTKSVVRASPTCRAPNSWSELIEVSKNPLVVVGALTVRERAGVLEFLRGRGMPVYFEAQSGLRECRDLESARIHVADRIFERAGQNGYAVDGVLRIGGVPTHRLWRDLEDRFPELPVLCVSRTPFPGLSRPAGLLVGDVSAILQGFGPSAYEAPTEFLRADRSAKNKLLALLESEPSSEPGLIHQLSKIIPSSSRFFVGNSLPIREWDLAATWDDRGTEVLATRGVNGIDGQISTFLGLCDPDRPNWALFGDLTALYDLTAPWILSQQGGVRADIVVMNNGGGKIFERMYAEREFQNPHELRFKAVAELWGLEYIAATRIEPEWKHAPKSGKTRLIELFPDVSATARFWKEHSSL